MNTSTFMFSSIAMIATLSLSQVSMAHPRPQIIEVKVSAARLRTGPSQSSTAIALVRNGEAAKVRRTQGDWMEIEFGNSSGWVHKSLVTPSRKTPTPPLPPTRPASMNTQQEPTVPLPPPRPASLRTASAPVVEQREEPTIEPAAVPVTRPQVQTNRPPAPTTPAITTTVTTTPAASAPSTDVPLPPPRPSFLDDDDEKEDYDDTKGPVKKNHEMSAEEAKKAMEATLNNNCVECQTRRTQGALGGLVDAVNDITRSATSLYDDWDYSMFKSQYQDSNQAKCLERNMAGGIRVGRNLCYRAVKMGMQRTKVIGTDARGSRVYLEGNSASMALAILKSPAKTGGRPHINLMDRYKGKVNSRNAPVGSLLVYTGPWIPLKANDARMKSLPRCQGSSRKQWRNDCIFSEYGQAYIYRNYVESPNGRRYYCSGAGTQHGHIEVRTTRGYSHFTETRAPIDATHPGCRVLVGVMADPKFLDSAFDDVFSCPRR